MPKSAIADLGDNGQGESGCSHLAELLAYSGKVNLLPGCFCKSPWDEFGGLCLVRSALPLLDRLLGSSSGDFSVERKKPFGC
jgi:hypothetical protein